MRVLIYGTSPLCHSGYGSAVRHVARGLTARGHDVAIYAWNSHVGPPLDWGGVPILPAGYHRHGQDMIAPYVRQTGADLLLTICDPWILKPEGWQNDHDRPVVHWYPIHSEPVDPRLAYVVARAAAGLCYSRWGQGVMEAAGVSNSRHVPLGVDPDTYRPLDRAACRRKVFPPEFADRYIIGSVAANSSTCPFGRKAFDVLARAFAAFRARHEGAVLYLHTLSGEEQGGYDLTLLLEALGLEIGQNVLFVDRDRVIMQGYDDSTMAQIYNACDVMSQASLAEGFGLPILEAQSCGVPVLTTDYSSMPEITVHGRAIPVCTRLWAPGAVTGWVAVPHVDALASALDDVCAGRLTATRQAGLDLARFLSWDRVIDDHLLPALQDVLS